LTKKEKKKSLAEQFLADDQAENFSKKKYEGLSEKKRRVGLKKRVLKEGRKRNVKK
jgi:hypothetical protein